MRDDERRFLIALTRKSEGCPPGRVPFPRDLAAELRIPAKRAAYLCGKWARRGWYDYGVNVDLGWLTDRGREAGRLLAD